VGVQKGGRGLCGIGKGAKKATGNETDSDEVGRGEVDMERVDEPR